MVLKRIFLGFLCLLSVEAHEGVVHQNTLHSASELDYPPYCIVTNGKADGFAVELLRNVLHVMNYEVDFYVDSWDTVRKDLQVAKIDVLPLVGRTPEREAYFDFSVPYLEMHGAIVVRKGAKNIEKFEDLREKEIIVMKGDNAEEFLMRKGISSRIITTPTFEEALKLLSSGKHDAVVVQKLVGTQLIEKLNLSNLQVVHEVIKDFKQDFSFAVSEGNKGLLAILNEGLAIVIANGTYERLYKKWLSPLDREDHQLQMLVTLLSSIVGVMAFIGAIATFWQRSLKRQVVAKTKELLQSEENLRLLNLSLESKVREAIAEMQKKDNLIVAQSRQAAMGEMISMIAHQWRQPISVIGMIANNMLLDSELNETIDKEELKKAMDDITFQVEHLSRTIDDFRNFFKPSKAKESAVIKDIIANVMHIVGKSLENHSIQIAYETPLEYSIVLFKNELLQVLVNLINNAKDAISENTHSKGHITLVTSIEEDKLVIKVIDNGGGIKDEVLAKLGEPYVSTKALSGTGLGLYMSKMIIEKHLKGTLHWENVEGGACFSVSLPFS